MLGDAEEELQFHPKIYFRNLQTQSFRKKNQIAMRRRILYECFNCKKFSKNISDLYLDKVSFGLEQGKITGFIGRNGAGKSTTLNSLFNFVHPDSGAITFFGLDFSENETKIKEKLDSCQAESTIIPLKSLKKISAITKMFYAEWDEAAYQKYIKLFNLDENKTPAQLSAGMKVKYALTLALSHNADLLILDEPTSGLDPVSRDDLLDVFMGLCDAGKTIMFSTRTLPLTLINVLIISSTLKTEKL